MKKNLVQSGIRTKNPNWETDFLFIWPPQLVENATLKVNVIPVL